MASRWLLTRDKCGVSPNGMIVVGVNISHALIQAKPMNFNYEFALQRRTIDCIERNLLEPLQRSDFDSDWLR